MEKSFTLERTFDAPSSSVWRAITEVAFINQWFWPLSAFEPRVGFEFSFQSQPCTEASRHLCKVTEVVKGKKLSYTWRYEGYTGDSEVTFELLEEGKRTRLRMTHAGLDSFRPVGLFEQKDFAGGWTTLIGTALPDVLKRLAGS